MDRNEFEKKLDEILFSTPSHRSIKKDYDIPELINAKICAECGGRCCKSCGCHFSPDDFPEISFEYLKKELEKGYISIDLVDGEIIYENTFIYILRIRNYNAPIVDTKSYFRTPCVLLTKNGCKLDYEHRPTGGKLLIPKETISTSYGEERHCISKYDIEDCCYEWKPYQKVLHELAHYFKGKYYSCSL